MSVNIKVCKCKTEIGRKFSNMFPIFLKFQKMLIICETLTQRDVQQLTFFYQGLCFSNANHLKEKYIICEI